jgi:hypothetical protein
MRASSSCVCLLFGFLLVGIARASEEGAFEFQKFRFESRDESGPVVIQGAQGDHGISALRITAFRKSFKLAPAQLKQLRGLIVNGVQLSGEGGYRGLGGRTLYLVLSMGFSSGITNSRLVTISEEDGIKIEKRR